MKIFYRTCSKSSTHKIPLVSSNKKDIIEICFQSFSTFNSSSFDLIVLDDDKLKLGNVGTFHRQLDMVCELDNEEIVMLVEDDYLWVPGKIEELRQAAKQLFLVSPYDHPGHYTEDRFREESKKMRLINGHTYRTAPSNTLTFACQAWVIKQNVDLIKSFCLRDHDMFQSLPVQMWCPVPSFATHLVDGLLAPNVDWESLVNPS